MIVIQMVSYHTQSKIHLNYLEIINTPDANKFLFFKKTDQNVSWHQTVTLLLSHVFQQHNSK